MKHTLPKGFAEMMKHKKDEAPAPAVPEHKKEGRGMHKDEKHHGGRMKHPRGG